MAPKLPRKHVVTLPSCISSEIALHTTHRKVCERILIIGIHIKLLLVKAVEFLFLFASTNRSMFWLRKILVRARILGRSSNCGPKRGKDSRFRQLVAYGLEDGQTSVNGATAGLEDTVHAIWYDAVREVHVIQASDGVNADRRDNADAIRLC